MSAEQTYDELVTESADHIAKMIGSLQDFIGANQMMAYIVMMTTRLIELHRVLKPTGRSPGWHQNYQRIRLLTIAELLRGATIDMPPQYGTFKRSQIVREVSEKQQELEMFS